MRAITKIAVFKDEWCRSGRRPMWPFRWIFAPPMGETYEFTNYVLGFRLEPTTREMKLIESKGLSGQPVLTLREGEIPLTFADLLGPEMVPEVNPSQTELLRVEARVREAAVIWTRAFEAMDCGD